MNMNKKLSILFLLSFLALIFMACSNGEDKTLSSPPVADFEFTVDKLTVTFNNTSTNNDNVTKTVKKLLQ